MKTKIKNALVAITILLILASVSSVALSTEKRHKKKRRNSKITSQILDEVQRARQEATTLRSENERMRSELEARIDQLEKQLISLQSKTTQEQQIIEEKAITQQIQGEKVVDQKIAETNERIDKLDERVEVAHDRLKEHAQTRVETAEKFGVRLFGTVLVNMAYNSTRTQDSIFGIFSLPQGVKNLNLDSNVNGTLRQTILGLSFKGPQFGAAKLSGDITFDLSGGNPPVYNGSTSNIFRLRTARIRLDFARGAIVAGQDVPVISPLNPTSFASVGIPALSDSGNLWSWTPQIKGEYELIHRPKGTLLFEAAALAPLSGDEPILFDFFTKPGFGERSNFPALQARLAFIKGPRKIESDYFDTDEANLQIGIGTHYGRQKVLNQIVNSAAVTSDFIIPLMKKLSLSGEFFWGRALAGLGGGIQQGLVLPQYGTNIIGIRSVGGWAQLKYRPITKLEMNFAYGADDPYQEDLQGTTFSIFGGGARSLNRNFMSNVIYHYRSNLFLAIEHRFNETFYTRANSNYNNHFNIALGYKF